MKWIRQEAMSEYGEEKNEIWIRQNDESSESFNVKTYLGKKTNLLKLKKSIVEDIPKQLEYYKETREDIYKPENVEQVDKCPVCQSSSSETTSKSNIYGANYVQCKNCTHVYVIKRPTKSAIEGFYLNNITYAATYTDKSAAESRLNAIAVPWRDWTIKVYEETHGKKPERILDVGSGAGHFVEACRRAGLKADGIELSESSRKFSQEIWGIELDGRDFIEAGIDYEGYDIVTFWGLLEHTPNPGKILETAYDIVSKSENGGLVISKIPRWDSLSAAAQRENTSTIIRHLDPMGHIMCFTDASAAELYHKCKFEPVAAWYYGMDVYETLMQVGNSVKNYEAFANSGELQMELQQYVDEMKFSDGLTLVGAPIKD
ncbi:MAG: class I SAM-dependent methyltransferase [bacterium]|nr:class I SAM-dependent methyltransferase [bacterium]